MVLVFSISNFFINKNSHGRKLSLKKVPSSGNSALDRMNDSSTKKDLRKYKKDKNRSSQTLIKSK